MQIIEVKDSKTWKLFHKVPHLIYKGDADWICPLEKDVKGIFTPDKNKAFQKGEAICYVLLKDKKPIGRIAAFVDGARNEHQAFKTGGIGFFECINDEAAAFQLFQKAEAYLLERNVKAIDGPINFGERDKFWGLYVKGTGAPYYQENYNPAYYQDFFIKWGFRPFEQILSFLGDISKMEIDRLGRIARVAKKRFDLHCDSLSYKNPEKYADDFCSIYNEAFKDYDHFHPLVREQVLAILMQMKPVADPFVVSFVYHKDQPVTFCAMMPEINEFLKNANGKLNIWTLPGFLLRKYWPNKKIIKGVAFGSHPDYQNKAGLAIIADYLYPHGNKYYHSVVLTTIRGHNTKMIKTASNLGVKVNKVHIAYRKILDKNIAFEPFEFYEEA